MSTSYLSRIPFAEFSFEATRSRGPGGQHVNKTNSAVLLRWNPQESAAFNGDELQRLRNHLPLLDSGELLIRSEEFRSQEQNKSACLKKLENLLEKALFIPKKRFKTRPTKSSQRKRVDSKSKNGEIKRGRRKVNLDQE